MQEEQNTSDPSKEEVYHEISPDSYQETNNAFELTFYVFVNTFFALRNTFSNTYEVESNMPQISDRIVLTALDHKSGDLLYQKWTNQNMRNVNPKRATKTH